MNFFLELLKAFKPGQDGFVFMWVLAGVAAAAAVLIIERWIDIARRTNVDAEKFAEKLRQLINEDKYEEAGRICDAGGKRILPRILGAGVKAAEKNPQLAAGAMEEETLYSIPRLEKRTNLVLMFGNISTLLGLMGTIYGLILSFDAVAQPDVEAIQKSSMLASGISAAMNTTLLGLMISVPCVLLFSILRSKVDTAVQEIDRYATAILKSIMPRDEIRKDYKISAKRIKEEVDTEPNIAPMMNLMVILIPLLLSSAEFVKIGAIELKLPESSQGGGGGGEGADQKKDAKLDLGIAITTKGFNLFHYFKSDSAQEGQSAQAGENAVKKAEIPLQNGEYDYEGLNKALAEVKRKTLVNIVRAMHPEIPEDAELIKLFNAYMKNDFSAVEAFKDHESIKIVAEDTIKYQTVVSVMDAARGISTQLGKVTMFPNVSLAGGIIH